MGLSVLFLFGLLALASGQQLDAVVRLFGTANRPNSNGTVLFTSLNSTHYQVQIQMMGLPPGPHAVHIHQWGDITASDSSSTGGHWNPTNAPHGCYGVNATRHDGDIGEVVADAAGNVDVTLIRNLITFMGPTSALGRGFVVHASGDDCKGTTGNAGSRLTHGVVGIANNNNVGLINYNATAVLVARLFGTASYPGISGTIYIRNDPAGSSKLQVYARISGLTPYTYYGFHFHSYGDFSDFNAALTAGGHYNPNSVSHALPTETNPVGTVYTPTQFNPVTGSRHAGDLGNVMAASDGSIYLNDLFDVTTIYNLIGRGVILHANPDQGFARQATGNAGGRLGMGVIGVSSMTWPTPATSPSPSVYAVARLFPTSQRPNAFGSVTFLTNGSFTDVVFNVSGLPANSLLGVHVHSFGDMSSTDGDQTAVGSYFDPLNYVNHSCPYYGFRRVGDLGNIQTDANGNFYGTLKLDLLPLLGPNTIVGRSLVVSSVQDDCVTQPFGYTVGTTVYSLLQGVIGVSSMTDAPQLATVSTGALIANLVPTASGAGISGTVRVRPDPQGSSKLQVYVRLAGLVPGQFYGLHIHQFGDLSDLQTGNSLGPHWDPAATATHALPVEVTPPSSVFAMQMDGTPINPVSTAKHAGDLGNVLAQADGQVYSVLLVDVAAFGSLVGRGLVLHALTDRGFAAQPAGASGSRLLAGVLGVASSFPSMFDVNPSQNATAIARLFGTALWANATGTIRFVSNTNGSDLTTIIFNLASLPPNALLGIHVHEFGDLTVRDGAQSSIGMHWNPMNWPHGCPYYGYRHAGDLGNIQTDANGNFVGSFVMDLLSLIGGNSIIGRSIVIQNMYDDCTSTDTGVPDGTTSYALAFGVIGVENSATQSAANTNTRLTDSTYNTAVAVVQGTGISGQVWLQQITPTLTKVYARITGLQPKTYYGLHIHEFGDYRSLTDFSFAGGHYNPDNFAHALPSESNTRHMGDMGNAYASNDGTIYFNAVLNLIRWNTSTNILGRGIVLHALPDQGQAVANTGGAGSRIGFGVIGISGQMFPTVSYGAMGYAVARFFPTATAAAASLTIAGLVNFKSGTNPLGVEVSYSITGLAPNTVYAMHIHQWGNISDPAGLGTGGHFNPYGQSHACDGPRHMGDLGNITSNAQGVAAGTIISDLIELHGVNSTIGRAIVLHAAADNCVTQPTGNAGGRLAQGVIGQGNFPSNALMNAYTSYPADSSTILTAVLHPTTGNTPYGQAWFRYSPRNASLVQVYARFKACQPGKLYGLHVHQYGDWTSLDANSAGSHFNPFNGVHALPSETNVRRMAGEFGNIVCQPNGEVYFDNDFDITQIGGPYTLAGHGLIIHGQVDQGTLQPPLTNFRESLGVIGISSGTFPAPETPPATSATARLFGTVRSPNAAGVVRIVSNPLTSTVTVTYNITGLAANSGSMPYRHSLIMHSWGDITTNDGAALGDHFSPYTGWTHACYPNGRHVGDIGDFDTDSNGNANGVIIVDLITLFGAWGAIGRSVVVHEFYSTCDSQPNGAVGDPFMQGVLAMEGGNTLAGYTGGATLAIAAIKGFAANPNINGIVYFAALTGTDAGKVKVIASISGLAPGASHGLHIHTYGDLFPGDSSRFSSHYDPAGTSFHALPTETMAHHAGDLGFVTADGAGRASYTVTVTLDLPSIIGRGLALHTNTDQGSTAQPSGNGGPIIAGATIGLTSTTAPVPPTLSPAASINVSFVICGLAMLVALIMF